VNSKANQAGGSPVVAEIDACITRIVAFQAAQGRQVAARIKRSKKGRAGMTALAALGVPIPEDFAALYEHYDGISAMARMSFWQAAVFLDALWQDSAMLLSANQIARLQQHPHAECKISAFRTTHGVSYDLFPDLAENGEVPLVANLGPLSPRTFIAFDSTLAMLRSICAAQDAGVLSYATDRIAHYAPFGRRVEENELCFDPKALWDVIRRVNRRCEYWELLAAGPIDWQETTDYLPKDGRLQLDPAVRAIVLGEDFKPKS
jgi:hypothetical protein